MEQRRIELTLTRLQNSLQEKINEIEKLRKMKEEKRKRLHTIRDLRTLKLDFFKTMKDYADMSINSEILQERIEKEEEHLHEERILSSTRKDCIKHHVKELAALRDEVNRKKTAIQVARRMLKCITMQQKEQTLMMCEDIAMHR